MNKNVNDLLKYFVGSVLILVVGEFQQKEQNVCLVFNV